MPDQLMSTLLEIIADDCDSYRVGAGDCVRAGIEGDKTMSSVRVNRNILGVGEDFDVWLDTEEGEDNGIVIGTGESREAAIASAIHDLEEVLQSLRSQQ